MYTSGGYHGDPNEPLATTLTFMIFVLLPLLYAVLSSNYSVDTYKISLWNFGEELDLLFFSDML